MDNNFKDKAVLITGSSFGIGQGAARAFADAGAKVLLASRNRTANMALLEEIKAKGEKAVFMETDITDRSQIKRMVDTAVEEFGGIDIAINNAGIEGTPGVRTGDYEESVWDEVMDVNLKGVWLSMKFELQVMVKEGKGNIINISSLAGLKGGGAGAAYHASKFGVVGLTKSAAIEYAKDNIRVNAICPAVIDTPMADRAFDTHEKRDAALSMHPVGRFGKVSEVVSTILWLASDESAFVTGTAIPVDGGVSI